jgi:hypothetical protein
MGHKLLKTLLLQLIFLTATPSTWADSFCSAVVDRGHLEKVMAFISHAFNETVKEVGLGEPIPSNLLRNPFKLQLDPHKMKATPTKNPFHATLCYGGSMKEWGPCLYEEPQKNVDLFNNHFKVSQKKYAVSDVLILGKNKKFIALMLTPNYLFQKSEAVPTTPALLHISIMDLPANIEEDDIAHARAQSLITKLKHWFLKHPEVKLFEASCRPVISAQPMEQAPHQIQTPASAKLSPTKPLLREPHQISENDDLPLNRRRSSLRDITNSPQKKSPKASPIKRRAEPELHSAKRAKHSLEFGSTDDFSSNTENSALNLMPPLQNITQSPQKKSPKASPEKRRAEPNPTMSPKKVKRMLSLGSDDE